MAFVYLDSSVLVAIALGDPRGVQALAILGSRDACTSALATLECQAGFRSSSLRLLAVCPRLSKRSMLFSIACGLFR